MIKSKSKKSINVNETHDKLEHNTIENNTNINEKDLCEKKYKLKYLIYDNTNNEKIEPLIKNNSKKSVINKKIEHVNNKNKEIHLNGDINEDAGVKLKSDNDKKECNINTKNIINNINPDYDINLDEINEFIDLTTLNKDRINEIITDKKDKKEIKKKFNEKCNIETKNQKND